MQRSRSRFPDRVPSSSYWGSKDTREPESEEKKRLLDVLEKFRNLRPYLNKRLKSILAAGRERELADLVDDIKYYLNVMNDLIADEHHGIDTILGFIENVHEMIRTDPVPMEKHGLMDSNDTDDDDYRDSAPRSPSPSPGSPVGSYSQSQQPRRIPVERERNDHNPFQDKDSRHLAGDVWNTNSNNLGFQYSRRSDVDMRTLHDIRALPDEVFRSGGRGSSMSNQRRPSDNSMGSHDNYGRMGHGREDSYRDRSNSDIDRRYDRNRDSEFDYHRDRDRNNDRFRESSSFRERGSGSSEWGGNHSGADSSFDRHGDRLRERHSSDQWTEGRDRDRNNWFPERKYDRDSRNLNSDHMKQVPQDRDLREPLDESLFERRPCKPEPHSNSSNASNDNVHFNYNHGPPSKDPSPVRRPDVDRRDKDMRSPVFPPAAGVGSSPLVQSPSVPSSPSPLIGNIDPSGTPNSKPSIHSLNQMPANISNMPNTFQPPINMNVPLANQNLTPAQLQAMMQGMAAMFHNFTQQGMNPGQQGMNPQQPTMTPQVMNQLLLNSQNLTSPGANSPNVNLPNVNNVNPNMNQQNMMNQNHPNQNMNMGIGFNGPHNRFGGLLPTPPVSNDLRFQNPTNQRMFRPQSDMHSPGAMNNFNQSRQNINTNHSNMISQIQQKAQLHFTQRNVRPTFGRRDGPNFPNGPHGVPPHNQSFPVRPAVTATTSNPIPPKSSPLATNQMLAEPPTLTDPRLNRQNRNVQNKDQNPPKESQPVNEASTSSSSDTNKKRVEHSRTSEVSKTVSDTRDKVAASLPSKKVNKVNKLSEFRKEVEKEGMIRLGDKSAKGKKPSFEDALLLAPTKPPVVPSKSPKRLKDKSEVSKDDHESVDSGSHKKTMTDKEKTKTHSRSNSKSRNSRSGRSSTESNSTSIRFSSSSSKTNSSKASEKTPSDASSTISTATTKLNFKIPKIKKPPPPPVIEEITIETPSSSSPKPSDSQSEDESDKDIRKPADSNSGSEVASSTTSGITDDTEDLIKTFILKSMSTTDVERLNTNPEVYNEIAKKLQEHLKKIVTDDKDDKPSSSTGDSTSLATSTETSEQPIGKGVTTNDKQDESPPTKKRCSKRRSDLEKLHDALKEMRFDSMLPLGPRRCTNKAAAEDPHQESGSTTSDSNTLSVEDVKQAEGSSKGRSTVDQVIEEISNPKTKPKMGKKKSKMDKKVVVPKKGVTVTTKKPAKNTTKEVALILKTSVSTVKNATSKKTIAVNEQSESEAESGETGKGKRGRKRKLDGPKELTDGTEDETSDQKAEDKNLPPKRYMTRSQAKKISNPPPPEVKQRAPRTGWEKWDKKVALINAQRKKKQEEKNKKFVATFNASKIKLKLKKQRELNSKMKTKLKRKIETTNSQQPSKKSRIAEPNPIGANSIVVNSGLCKIKLETDWVEPTDVKSEHDLSITESIESAEMNHLIFDVQSVVRSVVNTNTMEPAKDSLPTETTIGTLHDSVSTADDKNSVTVPEATIADDLTTKASKEMLMDDSVEDIEMARSKDMDDLGIEPNDSLESSMVTSDTGVVTRRGRKRKVRSDVFSCTLCPFSGKKIVAHYVNLHLNSTIPAACIDQSAFDSLVEQNQSTSPQLFEISYKDENDEKPWPCLFCSERHDDVREYFEHLTTHTGEFMYACGICSIRHPYLKTMTNHLKSHKLKEATGEIAQNLVTLYEPTVSAGGSELYAYMCNDCHYFQLLTDSIARHLETENHSPSEAISIKFHGPEILINVEPEIKKEPFDKSVFLGTDEQIATETLHNSNRNPLKELTVKELEALQSQFLRLQKDEAPAEKIIDDKNSQKLDNDGKLCRVQTESIESITEQCKDRLNWIVGLVQADVDPKVSFNIKLSDTPYDCDDLAKMIRQEQANNFRMDLSASDSSEEEEEEDDDISYLASQEFDFKEPRPLSRKTCVPVVSQYQYDLIVKLKNNHLFIVDKSWPKFQKYRNKVVLVARSGDGYEHSVLLHGFSVPVPANQDFPPPVVIPECEKLKMGLVGEYRAGIKDLEHYQNMLAPEKLRHLFKCMGKTCSYSGDSQNGFFHHLISHGMKNEEGDFVDCPEQNWICCSYCSLQYRKAEDLCNHIVHQHSKSLYQCSHCFYRCFWESYISLHYAQCHPGETPTTIHCETVAISNFVESSDVKLYVYRCLREYCPERSKQFLFRNEFMDHLKVCVPPGGYFNCHICYASYKDHRHLVYHYKCHSIFRYQCFYCIFGSEEYSDMESHAFEVHPNLSGKIFDRHREKKKSKKDKIAMLKAESCLSSIRFKKGDDRKDETNMRKSLLNNPSNDYDNIEPEEKEGRVTNLEGTTLYRCANFRCDFSATNATHYKDHVVICDYMPEDKLISCFHCPKKVKSVFSLMEHIKIHGKQRQTCSLCPFKCCVNSELTKHFKNVHKVANYRVSKSQEDADEPEATVYPKETSSKLVLPETLQENFMLLSNKARFLPSDIDKIPTNSIFGSFVGCGLCTFTTKVRTNILRHLKLHLRSDLDGGETVVPTTAPVNPVPCLERNELMFDKMTNWAGSSHENKQGSGVTKEDAARLPQFIKEQFRYECSVPNCQQITVDDSMLRAHMKALHSEVDVYRCPHCHKDSSHTDSRNTVQIDKIGNHLKLHGPKLFRCGHCDYIHTQSRVMEKHVGEKHVEKKPIHYLIRNFDNDGNLSNRRTSVEDNPRNSVECWRCTLCAYKTQFSSWEDAKNHCTKHHNVTGQFSCSSCSFSSDYVFEITTHVTENQCVNPSVAAEKGRIMIAFCRNEALASLETKEESSTNAIWKRTTPGIKHIRGIFLEEGKETVQAPAKSDSSPAKSIPSALPKSPAKAQSSLSAKSTISPSKSPQKPNQKSSINSLTINNSSKLMLSKPSIEVKHYVCTKCNKYRTKNVNDLTIHLHNEFNYRRYKCKLCDHKFITESSLKGHIVGDHQVSYNYSLCELLPTDQNIEDYVSKCIEDQQNQEQSSSSSSNVSGAGAVPEENLKCKHCSMSFASHHNYRIHILAKHVAANRFSCKYCPLAFWNEGIAKQHHFRSAHASMPFAVVRNEELEAKLTPEFWLKEYGIPISKSLKYSAAGSTVLHCDQCIFKTNHPLKLQKHKDEIHPITTEQEPPTTEEITGSDNPEIIDLTSSDLFATGPSSVSTGNGPPKKPRLEKQNVYKCLHCKKNCFTAKGMRQHWLKYHSSHPSGLECSYYEFKHFTDSMQMLAGINLVCYYCNHTENSISGMRSHNTLRHPGQRFRMKRRKFKATDILACDSCDFQGETFTIIKKHYQLKHNNKLPLFTKLDLTPVERICTPVGKLIEDKVMYSCTICHCDYPSTSTFNKHLMDKAGHGDCEPNLQYNRCVIQENVEIPHDEQDEILIGDEVYRCPSCSYETEDRNVMIQNHLATHIKTFVCPLCDHGFEISLDSLFHIRHHHHEARIRPVSNKSAYLSYVAMRDKIILAPRSDSLTMPSTSTNFWIQ